MMYEVQIMGFGPNPLCDHFEARNVGLALLMARDKYGSWIRFGSVTEKPAKPLKKRHEASKQLSPAKRRKRIPFKWATPAEDNTPHFYWG